MIDETKIKLIAGKGGDGIVSFRREKYVPKGGPDGGDGGDGANIYIFASRSVDDLQEFKRKKLFKAEDGKNGRNKKMHGVNADDLILNVPIGTLVYEIKDNKNKLIADLKQADDKILICKGGNGGLGNDHFKSSTNQTPKQRTLGTKGQKKQLYLELRMIADIGIIGLPNAGKSTLINTIAHSNYKTANYPFTTLEPNLAAIKYHGDIITFADIPGIIRNASKGIGLGLKFLKHIQRTKILIHMVDINSTDIKQEIQTITRELKEFDPKLVEKAKIMVFNKIDLLDKEDLDKKINKLTKQYSKKDIYFISATNKTNIDKLIERVVKKLNT